MTIYSLLNHIVFPKPHSHYDFFYFKHCVVFLSLLTEFPRHALFQMKQSNKTLTYLKTNIP